MCHRPTTDHLSERLASPEAQLLSQKSHSEKEKAGRKEAGAQNLMPGGLCSFWKNLIYTAYVTLCTDVAPRPRLRPHLQKPVSLQSSETGPNFNGDQILKSKVASLAIGES